MKKHKILLEEFPKLLSKVDKTKPEIVGQSISSILPHIEKMSKLNLEIVRQATTECTSPCLTAEDKCISIPTLK